MKNIEIKLLVIVLVILLTISSCITVKKVKPVKKGIIVAEWENGSITKKEIKEQIANIPVQYRAQFKMVEGQKKLLDDLVARELFLAEGIANNIHKDKEVLANIKEVERPYYIDTYQNNLLDNKAKITEQEISNYYDEHHKSYRVQPSISIRYLQAQDEETANKIKSSLDRGDDYIDILNTLSTNEFSKKTAGRIDRIRNNGYIPGVGLDKSLDSLITATESKDFLGPFKTKTGYHFFRKLSHRPATIKPYEEVKDSIKKKLTIKKVELQKDDIYADLIKSYKVTIDTQLVNSVNFNDKIENDKELNVQIVNSSNKNVSFSVGDFYKIYQKSDKELKPKFNDLTARIKLLKKEIYFSLMYEEAKNSNINIGDEHRKKLKQQKDMIITKVAFNKLVKDMVTVADSTVQNWYNEHKNQYKVNTKRSARIFEFEEKEQADEYHNTVTKILSNKKLSNEEINNKFSKIIDENCDFTRNSGILSNVPQKGSIPMYGTDKFVLTNIWGINEGVSDVFKTKKETFAFVNYIDETPSYYKDISEVKTRIEKKLKGEKLKSDYFTKLEDLKIKYELKTYPDNLKEILTPKELFELAQKSKNQKRYAQSIKYYDEIISKYKDGKNDANAQFMKGYLYSEEMNDKEKAISTFKTFLKIYSDNDLAESAKAMLDDLEGVKRIDSFFIDENENDNEELKKED
ncbi:MAG: peptidyl-prolyl cis-trans isomerase [Candidatus Cloacimonadota bacterium]|nr:peptidyl-prolyl cis-trans isomerase [Candidatus Cloacimonadota bacterium]